MEEEFLSPFLFLVCRPWLWAAVSSAVSLALFLPLEGEVSAVRQNSKDLPVEADPGVKKSSLVDESKEFGTLLTGWIPCRLRAALTALSTED